MTPPARMPHWPTWIKTDLGLPETGVPVLVLRSVLGGAIGNPDHPGYPNADWVEISAIPAGFRWFACDFISTGCVTHWMPLPEPPK